MKTKILIVALLSFLASCKEGGGLSAPGPALNPELENGVWSMGYSNGVNIYEDKIAIVDNVAVIKVYCVSCGNNEIDSVTWYVTALDDDTLQVNDGSGTFNVDYTITGNQLDIYFEDGDHNVYTR